ncbi:glycosyltransferase [Staphylococcus chromogenes]|nr:glycosyltransferase [Staphylococcus chromogenes]
MGVRVMLYTVTSTLPEFHGGRTKSLLSRNLFLETQLQQDHTILTTNYNPNYPQIEKRFIQRGVFSKMMKHINIFEWISNGECYQFPTTPFRNQPKYQSHHVKIKGLKHEIKEKTPEVVRYYDNKQYVRYRKYEDIDKGILKFEDFMIPGVKHKIERWEYNEWGYLHKKTTYSTKRNKRLADAFYNQHGEIYCKRYFSDDERSKIIQIVLYKNGQVYKVFDSENAFFTYFFEAVLPKNAIVFNDARLIDKSLLDVKQPLKSIFVFHSSHLNLQGALKSRYKVSQARHDEISKIFVLTEQQKADVMKDYDIGSDRVVVIPHFTKINSTKAEHKEDNFVFIGRIDENKQVPKIIDSFKIYHDQGYPYGLNIYGYGEDKDIQAVEAHIKDLNLTEKVRFHGRTHQPDLLFSKHRASLLASQYEGFALSVMESLNNDCPVIAYDIKYGPGELIQNGINGYTVPPQDVEGMAQKMIEITKHPIPHVKLDEKFSEQAAIENYRALLKDLEEN